jgi:uncharacterized membrane protein
MILVAGLFALTVLHFISSNVGARTGRSRRMNRMDHTHAAKLTINSFVNTIWAVGASGLSMVIPGVTGREA